jgi:SRSO17 transposase
VRVRAARRGATGEEEWLLVEWPKAEKEPTKYWLSTLPHDIAWARMVDLAKLRWRIERDYQDSSRNSASATSKAEAGAVSTTTPRCSSQPTAS